MPFKPLPEGFTSELEFDVSQDDYDPWTVADLIDILQAYPQDARVWIGPDVWPDLDEEPIMLRPIETVFGMEGEVVL